MTYNPLNQYDVIHLGPYFCDLIIAGLADLPQLGTEIYGTELHMVPGGAFNTTYALHRLELKTGWISDFGSDHFSQFVLEKIKELGIDTTFSKIHDHHLCALSVALSFQYDRGFISYMDPCEPWNLIEILETYRPSLFLVGGLEYGPTFMDFAAAARQLGVTLVMDCQYRDVTLSTVTAALVGRVSALLRGVQLRSARPLLRRLKNDVCRMNGIAPAPNGGYYLVKGKGLPRIDVIGSARRVDWPRLVQQLVAVTQSEGPVVEP